MVRVEGDRGRGRGWSVPKATTADKWKDNASANEKAGETTDKWFFSTALVEDDFLLPWEVLQWMTAGTEAILSSVGTSKCCTSSSFVEVWLSLCTALCAGFCSPTGVSCII